MYIHISVYAYVCVFVWVLADILVSFLCEYFYQNSCLDIGVDIVSSEPSCDTHVCMILCNISNQSFFKYVIKLLVSTLLETALCHYLKTISYFGTNTIEYGNPYSYMGMY